VVLHGIHDRLHQEQTAATFTAAVVRVQRITHVGTIEASPSIANLEFDGRRRQGGAEFDGGRSVPTVAVLHRVGQCLVDHQRKLRPHEVVGMTHGVGAFADRTHHAGDRRGGRRDLELDRLATQAADLAGEERGQVTAVVEHDLEAMRGQWKTLDASDPLLQEFPVTLRFDRSDRQEHVDPARGELERT